MAFCPDFMPMARWQELNAKWLQWTANAEATWLGQRLAKKLSKFRPFFALDNGTRIGVSHCGCIF